MEGTKAFGASMVVMGVVMMVRGFTAEFLYDDTEGPLSPEELERERATPAKRLLALLIGVVPITLGVFEFLKNHQ